MDASVFRAVVFTSVLVMASAKSVLADNQGLELSFDRELTFDSTLALCGQLTCRAKGKSLTIDSVTTTEFRTTNGSRQLLTVTPTTPDSQMSSIDIKGNGTIENNLAIIKFELLSPTICDQGYFICEVVYTKTSGETGKQVATAGQDHAPYADTNLESNQSVSEPRPQQYNSPNPYTSPFWYLKDEVIEMKFESIEKRLGEMSSSADSTRASDLEVRVASLERRLGQEIDTTDAQDFSTIVSALEDRLVARISTLEDRVSPLFPPQPVLPQTNASQTLEDLDSSDTEPGQSQTDSQSTQQSLACERGMGDDVTKWYHPYIVLTHSTIGKQFLCDTRTDGGGWIVFQRRTRGNEDFYRRWDAYREGFGSVTGDFWLGNEAIHALTVESPHEMRIDFRIDGQEKFAQYSSFRLENEADKYRLRIGSYTGTIGQSSGNGLAFGCDKPFTTFDRDNDDHASNCAVLDHGAWWYKNCHRSNLNGMWNEKTQDGVSWYTGSTWIYPSAVEMKIRRVMSPTSG